MTRHLVIISGNDSSLPIVPLPDTTVTLVQTPDRATDLQRTSVDRYLEVPEITSDVLVDLLGNLHRDEPITALACFLEGVILEAARAADSLGLRANPVDAVATAKDKVRMREALERAGVPQRPWRTCRTAEEVIAFRDELGEPAIVVKPITGAGSAGVRLVSTDDEIRDHLAQIDTLHDWALRDNPDLLVLAEAVLPGREVSVEAITVDGIHEIVAVTDKITTGPPRFVEVGHRQPAAVDADAREAVERCVRAVLDAIGTRVGPSHTEVMIDGTDVWPIETHTRFGGDQIWELTQLTTGRHMATETLCALLDLPLPAPGPREDEAAIAFMTWSSAAELPPTCGVVRAKIPEERSADAHELLDSSGRGGYVLAAGPGSSDVALSAVASLQAPSNDAPILLMGPAKVLRRIEGSRLSSLLPAGSAVITNADVEVEPGHLTAFVTFDDFTHDDEIALVASELVERHNLQRVAVLAEADVLRAAQVRERHGLPGQTPSEALLFRDKPSMKAAVREAGIAVADHRVVSSAFELVDAAEALGFPCVVKPPNGRGSSGVETIADHDELRAFLRRGPFSDRGHTVELLVEAFQHGDQYRVDGVYQDGVPRLLSVARYVGSHLEYLAGGYLASVILPEHDEDAAAMLALARRVMEDALPTFDGGFHLEAFMTPDGPVFSEVGARLGGGSIPEEIELAYGADIIEETIRAQSGAPLVGERPRQLGLAGQVHVSPRPGLLVRAPETVSHPAVTLSEVAAPGLHYSAMSHTNAEYARAVFGAASVSDARTTIGEILAELEAATEWRTGDEPASTGDAPAEPTVGQAVAL
ncbi:ATP-grasp domain-containing protein [Nocardioides sp. Y6]|uniref:ATP-grasp domain-containing protein n=1 Tax=Nocardioides malaquae TaxID=2773426 RepID=A0ABR9RND4_9ACTN|nr:ATP-grasp domain-containing protein [Nocardioides malaquae]MBE7323086.1 ATP-grasp domain-containing protein [Nocardioides malaquae]